MRSLSVRTLVRNLERFVTEKNLDPGRRRGPAPKLSLAQLTTVCIVRSQWGLRSWKALFFNPVIRAGWRRLGGFDLGSYSGFMRRVGRAVRVLEAWLSSRLKPWSGLGAIDSTLIAFGRSWCRQDRLKYKRLRRQGADTGYGSTGPCFGLKLHLASTQAGAIHAFAITPASTHDLNPVRQGSWIKLLGSCWRTRGT